MGRSGSRAVELISSEIRPASRRVSWRPSPARSPLATVSGDERPSADDRLWATNRRNRAAIHDPKTARRLSRLLGRDEEESTLWEARMIGCFFHMIAAGLLVWLGNLLQHSWLWTRAAAHCKRCAAQLAADGQTGHASDWEIRSQRCLERARHLRDNHGS